MKSLTLVRRIAARPLVVFEAITTAEGVASWWGPDDVPVLLAEMDARVGGTYRVRFRTLDGRVHEACGELLEVVPPRRVVMSLRWALGGEPDEEGQVSRVEFELAPVAEGTELTFMHSGLSTDVSQKSHTRGWTGAFDKLVRRLGSAVARAELDSKGGIP
jgi:uncharacterized protein YndB with AHSA1/START domain